MSMKNAIKQNLIRYHFTTKKSCVEVVASDFSSTDELLNKVAELVASEQVIIVFDGSMYSDSTFVEVGEKIRLICGEYNSILLIKSRADIAYLLSADGVCLGRDDFSPLQAHEIVGEKFLIGQIGDDLDSSKYPLDFKISNGFLSSLVIDNKIPVRKL